MTPDNDNMSSFGAMLFTTLSQNINKPFVVLDQALTENVRKFCDVPWSEAEADRMGDAR